MSLERKEKKIHEKYQKLLEQYAELLEALFDAKANKTDAEKFIIEELNSINEYQLFLIETAFPNTNMVIQNNQTKLNQKNAAGLGIDLFFLADIILTIGNLLAPLLGALSLRNKSVQNTQKTPNYKDKKVKEVYKISVDLIITLFKYIYYSLFFVKTVIDPVIFNQFIDIIINSLNEELDGLLKTPYTKLQKELIEFRNEYVKKFNKLKIQV